jgi:hypothetical protein
MIFVVALDPESISSCAKQGNIACDHLIGVLLALNQNCLLAEFSGTWRLSGELRNAIKSIEDQGTRKIASSLLESMLDPNRYRFVETITGHEDDFDTPLGELLANHLHDPELDAIISEQQVSQGSIECTSISVFNQSNFARDRSKAACALIFSPGKRTADQLLGQAFGRLVKYCDFVEIYDRQMGKTMGGNYYDAIEHWCRFFAAENRNFELRIHTTRDQARSVKQKFTEQLEDSNVKLKVFAHDEEAQPHERFLRSSCYTFDVGRGVDLFDREGNCRDVKIGMSDHGAFSHEWRGLASKTPL